MGEKIPCAYSKIFPCDDCKQAESGCAREVEPTEEDAERHRPRWDQDKDRASGGDGLG